MRRALLLGGGAVALVALAMVCRSARDAEAIDRVREVERRLQVFCFDRRRLPDREEFARLFPELSPHADWTYWPARDGARAHVQYPLAGSRPGAPGTPKTSEFTAMTYAHVVEVRCVPPPRVGR